MTNAWNSLPPQTQAQIFTAAIVAVSVAAIVLTAGAATPVAALAISTAATTAASTTAYTVMAGNQATLAGAVGTAVSTAVATATTVATGGLGVVGVGAAFAGTAAADVPGSSITGAMSNTRPDISPEKIMVDSSLSLFGGSVTRTVIEKAGFGAVGRPATRLGTLANGLIHPSDYPRAAYQVYSGVVSTAYSLGAYVATNLGFGAQ